jgi:hypothetical protein
MGIKRDSISFRLLDSAYNAFIKRILWPETGLPRLSDLERMELANSIVGLIESSGNYLENGGNASELISIINLTGRYIYQKGQ